MNLLSAIAVFCGSNTGGSPAYAHGAASLGACFAAHDVELVFGGTHKGLMGILADSLLKEGGQGVGVITERLYDKGHLHSGLQRHEVVATMRERKGRMAELSDAFIALPGGIGTLEEFMEVWTLNQLGEIQKPLGLYNVNGFFDPFMAFIDHMIAERFLPAEHRHSIVLESDPEALLEGLKTFEPTTVPKWLPGR
ncbi:TIGR00730 family Rossman fold protein [Vreelandella malpeensis]|uniref:Cytokinin riboside 5'-monophosphate phosphoribohydrolase n=1 Tax=Vreelandella malpeensis TaxID=1172368 RepID=A0ABS8DRP7_9GAMM|nr:TIGR00730 family Rossman fold protein [Halomonas malpeensis]MCB8888997.1 TIGR00730 family Rossman fold protein [Halomonas malpeensis]